MFNGMKTAILSGITGQDSSFLAEILLEKGYFVVGLKRRASTLNTERVNHLYHHPNFRMEFYDSSDVGCLYKLLKRYQPEEFYSLMAQSHVRVSFDLPEFTVESLVMGTMRLFEAVRIISPGTKIYVASSSEMFGDNPNPPFNEESALMPASPYACAKCFTGRTKVYTENGLVNISRIKVGDLVWTHTGQLKRVESVFNRNYEGELLNVIVNNSSGNRKLKHPTVVQSNYQFTCTPEHPIMTDKGWKMAKDLGEQDLVSVVATRCLNCDKLIPGNRLFCSKECVFKKSWENHEYRTKQVNKIRKRFQRHNCLADSKSVDNRKKSFAKFLERKGQNFMEYYIDLLLNKCSPGFFKYVGDGKVCIGGYFPDWINFEKKAIIEFIGWGENLERRIKSYQKKINYLEQNGYKVLTIFGSEFKNPSDVEKKVAKFVSDLGSLEYVFEKIKSIKKYNTKNVIKVYNLEIEDDHSYVANGVVAHNCFCHNLARNYRKSYGMFISSGILFNHESERRGETFVSRKITLGAARIHHGLEDKLYLGNLEAKRDWGYAPDYMEAAWRMLQQDKPDDFVISTGETHSVREFAEKTFDYCGLGDYRKYVEIDEQYFRPHEVPYLLGDSSKAKKELEWEPKVKFNKLVEIMCEHDLNLVAQEKVIGAAKWKTFKKKRR